MKINLFRIAAGLALVIGLMAIAAGGQVLLGKEMDYYVINWLPTYNFLLGWFSALVTSVVIWRNDRAAAWLASLTLGLHSLVMVILLTAYRSVVAPDSLMAMTLRITVWIVILVLLRRAGVFQRRTI